MTDDKLGLAPALSGSHARLIDLHVLGPSGLRDEAVRAQLVNVAIGVGEELTEAPRVAVDFCVYVSVRRPLTGPMGHGPALVLIDYGGATRGSRADVQDRTFSDHGVMLWNMIRTGPQSPADEFCDPLNGMVGEPLTMRVLFNALDRCQAHDAADVIRDRLLHWTGALTFRDTLDAIRAVLQLPVRKHHAVSQRLLYQAASVRRGWNAYFPGLGISDFHAIDNLYDKSALNDTIGEWLVHYCSRMWKQTAETFNAPEPNEDEGLACTDPGMSDDPADDYVCTARVHDLWFGKKPRR